MIVLVHVTAYWLLVLLAGLVIVDAIPFDWARIERCAAALLVGVLASTCVSFVGSLWIGISPITALGGPLLIIAVGIFLRRGAWVAHMGEIAATLRARALPMFSSVGLVWRVVVLGTVALLFWVLFSHALEVGAGGVVSFSSPVWSDWSLHASIAQSYLLGQNLPPLDPEVSGAALHYPFLVDFQPALLETLGQSLWGALDMSSLAVALAAAVLIWYAAWRVVGRRELAATVGLVLVLFGGSLGFVGLYQDGCEQLANTTHSVTAADCAEVSASTPLTALKVVVHLPDELLHIPRYYDGEPFTGVLTAPSLPDLVWWEPLLTFWLPQRDFAYGMGVVALAVSLAWAGLRRREVPLLVAAGAVTGLVPLFNPLSFLAVTGIVAVWLLWARWWRGLMAFLAPLLVLGTGPLLLVVGGPHGALNNPGGYDEFPQIDLGWLSHSGVPCAGPQIAGTPQCTALYVPGATVSEVVTYAVRTLTTPGFYSGVVGFWLANTGVFIPLCAVIAAIRLRGPGGWAAQARELGLVRFMVPFFLLFAFANVVITQPSAWDNTKLFQFWYLGAAIPVAWILTVSGRKLWRAAAAVLLVSLVATGMLATLAAVRGQSSLSAGPRVSAQTVATAVEAGTSPSAVFLTEGQPNDPVIALAGRTSVLGWDAWPASEGQPLEARYQAVQAMYAGCPQAGTCDLGSLLREYKVSYVEFEPVDVNLIVANEAWYRAQNLSVLVQTAHYTIYDVRPLWSSPG